jgi:hypothetical protein
MSEKIALKLLSASDCTLFAAIFKKAAKSGQKCINLNADILIGQLYPDLDAAVSSTENGIPLPLMIYGPDAKPKHSLTRKITKKTAYKNWRLNGEVISGPPSDPHRYDELREGDIAVLGFHGNAVPSAIDLILISQSEAKDASIHAALMDRFEKKSMIAITAAELAEIVDGIDIENIHPVRIVAADTSFSAALEDAAFFGMTGTSKILKLSQKVVTAEALAKAKAKADLIGRDGEGLVNAYLADQVALGQLGSATWTASENAIAPYDFEIVSADGEKTLIDVKSTSGPFDNIIHISMAEVSQASEAPSYRLYRIYDLNEDGAQLRISENIHDRAAGLVASQKTALPPGFRSDSFSVDVAAFEWQSPVFIPRPVE